MLFEEAHFRRGKGFRGRRNSFEDEDKNNRDLLGSFTAGERYDDEAERRELDENMDGHILYDVMHDPLVKK